MGLLVAHLVGLLLGGDEVVPRSIMVRAEPEGHLAAPGGLLSQSASQSGLMGVVESSPEGPMESTRTAQRPRGVGECPGPQ